MARNEVSNELYNLMKSLLSFLYAVYRLYRPYIKCILLGIVTYVAFKVGRLSIVDSVEQNISKLTRILEKRADYTIFLPERIKKINKIRKTLLLIIMLSAAVWLIAYSFKIKFFRKGKIKYILSYMIVMVLSLVIAWVYQFILNLRVNKGKSHDLTINQKLYALQKELGPKAEGILKVFVCKDQMAKQSAIPRGICVKDNCKNYRQLLRQKTEEIQFLVNSAFNFSWCRICRQKLPFNQFLQFQAQIYSSQELPQQEEIITKNVFLLQELQSMVQWIKDVSPCNCSQIYWKESLKNIKEYKRRQKQLDKAILVYESKRLNRY